MKKLIWFSIFFSSVFSLTGQRMKKVDGSYVFDKAEYHLESVMDDGLDEDQAFVHSGLFLAWIITNELISESFKKENQELITEMEQQKVSPCQIYKNWDGNFLGLMLNKEGYNFTMSYFNLSTGRYLEDYSKTFELTDKTFFTVQDTWENYERISSVLDKAYLKWKK